MDQDSNQMHQQHATLCRNGCGFYATQSTDGMCSVCYKDYINKKQAPPVNMPASLAPSNTSSFVPSTCATSSITSSNPNVLFAQNKCKSMTTQEHTSSLDNAPSSSPIASSASCSDSMSKNHPSECSAISSSVSSSLLSSTAPNLLNISNTSTEASPSEKESATLNDDPSSSSPSTSSSKKSKSRCLSCKKKVGLTGFTCRCGGLFCSLHRYSDTHNCQFDYRELGAQEIRKSNPVVVAKKVEKI